MSRTLEYREVHLRMDFSQSVLSPEEQQKMRDVLKADKDGNYSIRILKGPPPKLPEPKFSLANTIK